MHQPRFDTLYLPTEGELCLDKRTWSINAK